MDELGDLLRTQANVKEISIIPTFKHITLTVKPDFAKLGPDFGDRAPKIIAKLALESPESVLSHIQKEGSFTVDVDGQQCKVVQEHLIVEREVKYPYSEVLFKHGFVYLNQERSEELEAEGYAREVMRRIQQGRKEAGLVKTDRIDLTLVVSPGLRDMLKHWQQAIQEKVGATKLSFKDAPPAKALYQRAEKVKDEQFTVAFGKA